MTGWDGVPWWTGGSAVHSDEIARLLAYAASQGSEGIVGPNDLAVRAQLAPNGTIRVLPGAAFLRNRAAGGQYQSYAGRLPVQDSPITVPPTSGTGGRTDLVVCRVENPNAAGETWQQPADPTVGPYIFTRVITGVPSTTRSIRALSARAGDSAITLARITQPENNTAVTQAMITDLRSMAMPRSKHVLFTRGIVPNQTEVQTANILAGEQWPNTGTSDWAVDVPEWATRVRVRGEWAQVLVPAGNVVGYLWARIGNDAFADRIETQPVIYDTPGLAGTSRSTFAVADDIAVPAAMRGTNQPVFLKARIATIYSGGSAARIALNAGSAVSITLDFLESPAEDEA